LKQHSIRPVPNQYEGTYGNELQRSILRRGKPRDACFWECPKMLI
jgi:hypothetical protein